MTKGFEYNPNNTSAVILEFDCPKCSDSIESHEISIPSPNMYGDNAADSQNDESDLICCSSCDEEIEITLHSSYGSGVGHIEGVKGASIKVTEIPMSPEASDFNNDYEEFN